MTHDSAAERQLLRPRDLITTLFADALDGDENAEDGLRQLAAHEGRAKDALAAIVVVEIDSRFRADPLGRSLPETAQHVLDRVLATVRDVYAAEAGRDAAVQEASNRDRQAEQRSR